MPLCFIDINLARYNRLLCEAGRDNKGRRNKTKIELAIRLHHKSRLLYRVGGPGNGEGTAEDRHDRGLTTSVRSRELTPLNSRLPRAVALDTP